MAIKRPDIYEHNNPNNAIVDSDGVRGGTRTPVADLSELYALASKIDQLKERSTRVFVRSENAYYELVDISNVDKPSGWGKELQIESDIFLVVSTLPETGVENKIYIVPSEEPTSEDEFDEWIWIEGTWERIGGVSIDLSNYYTKAQSDNLLNNKVDKDGDKQLSEEDFTTTLKNKLDSITAIFTTALKNAYDSAVAWISENGANILDHINSPHAPANAQKNSDITKSEIEAKLTGTISSHTHSYDDLTGKPDIPPAFDPTHLENEIQSLGEKKADKNEIPDEFNPSEHDLDEFQNASANPYARTSDIPPPFDPTYLEDEIADLSQNKQDNLGFIPENSENKAEALIDPNNTTYPTTKAVADAIANKHIVHSSGTLDLTSAHNNTVIFLYGTNLNVRIDPNTQNYPDNFEVYFVNRHTTTATFLWQNMQSWIKDAEKDTLLSKRSCALFRVGSSKVLMLVGNSEEIFEPEPDPEL